MNQRLRRGTLIVLSYLLIFTGQIWIIKTFDDTESKVAEQKSVLEEPTAGVILATSVVVETIEPEIEVEEISLVSEPSPIEEIEETEIEIEEEIIEQSSGKILNSYDGVCYGPEAKETYYNLNMNGVINIMRSYGYSEEEFPYWVDERGLKYFGDFIMIATDTYRIPKGTLVQTSLGQGMVVDHCESAEMSDIIWYDLAVAW